MGDCNAQVVCLLPVRNGARDLPGFFESARRFADAIVALDDGSTDDSVALLEAEPLVRILLRHPVRETFEGWHDAANRNELLAAAAALNPEWIISIDADERIDPGDARALRDFLSTDALPGVGYGFRCYSVTPDLSRALPNPIWVYRLFAHQPGAAFPGQALHFAPIPTTIQGRALIRTTLRIQHLGGSSSERRRERYEKYRQVDPECRYWPDYSSLLAEPDPSRYLPWQSREPGAPIIFRAEVDGATSDDTVDLAVEGARPDFSIVVSGRVRSAGIRRALNSAASSRTDASSQIVLVSTERPEPADPVDSWIEVAEGTAPGVMRNRALKVATGRWVIFLDERLSLERGALSAIRDAHQTGYALVTGPVGARPRNVREAAAFITAFGADHVGRASGAIDQPVRWASYDRDVLRDQGGFDERPHGDPATGLHRELAWRGFLAFRVRDVLLRYQQDEQQVAFIACSASSSGIATARYYLDAYGDRGLLLNRGYLVERLVRRVPRRMQIARRHARRIDARWETAGIVAGAELAGVAAEWTTLLRPGRGKALVLFGRPAGIALVAVRRSGVAPLIALVRFDLRVPFLRVVAFEPELLVPGNSPSSRSPLAEALGIVATASGPPRVTRFAAQDALGRWLQIDIDDLIGVDAAGLGWTDGAAPTVEDMASRLTNPAAIVRFMRSGGGRAAAIACDWAWSARLLALVRLRKLHLNDVSVVHIGQPGAQLDADDVMIIRSVLDPDTLRRPRNQRESLKRVEWA